MLEVATLWLTNKKGQILLARRSNTKKHDPGLWAASVSGKLEPGETVLQAVLRETKEELGVDTIFYRPIYLFKQDFVHPDGELRKFVMYGAKIDQKGIDHIEICEVEVAEIKWVEPDEMKQLLETEPGKIIPASAFVLWNEVLQQLKEKQLI